MNGKEFYYIRPNGNKYKGYWKNGKQNGEGEHYCSITDKWIKSVWDDGRQVV
jgi:hypothetical protein